MPVSAAGRVRPTEIRHLRDQERLRIAWSDGHLAEYDLPYLRGWCPCAACQGHGGERHFVSGGNARLEAIQPVGNYAVNLVWADGHDTGIYAYAYLREICPCGRCAGGSSDGSAE